VEKQIDSDQIKYDSNPIQLGSDSKVPSGPVDRIQRFSPIRSDRIWFRCFNIRSNSGPLASPELPILGFLDHMVVTNDFDQTFEHIEITRLKGLGNASGHVDSLGMGVHDNCDISRLLTYSYLTSVVTYVAND